MIEVERLRREMQTAYNEMRKHRDNELVRDRWIAARNAWIKEVKRDVQERKHIRRKKVKK